MSIFTSGGGNTNSKYTIYNGQRILKLTQTFLEDFKRRKVKYKLDSIDTNGQGDGFDTVSFQYLGENMPMITVEIRFYYQNPAVSVLCEDFLDIEHVSEEYDSSLYRWCNLINLIKGTKTRFYLFRGGDFSDHPTRRDILGGIAESEVTQGSVVKITNSLIDSLLDILEAFYPLLHEALD